MPEISIHTLRMEGDDRYKDFCAKTGLFQSTPSAWRVTAASLDAPLQVDISIHTLRMEGDPIQYVRKHGRVPISIHTLRMEGDPASFTMRATPAYFNPHPPHGG